jgi:hypothetical protein
MTTKLLGLATIALALVLTGYPRLRTTNAQTLKHHWTFDETLDDEENGNFAIGDDPPYVTGFDCTAGGAANFDGARTIQIDNLEEENRLPIDFSITAWVRLTENGPAGANFFQGAGIYFGEVTGVTADAGFVVIGDKAAFGIGGTSDVTIFGSTSIVDGQWHHVAALRDTTAGNGESTLSIYVDGVLDASGTTDYEGPVSATPFFVVGNNLVGDVDDLRVYDGVLSPEDLSDLADDPEAMTPTSFERGLSAEVLPGGQSLVVAVTASNVAASGGPVSITEIIIGSGITISATDAGVVIDEENGTVTLTFDSDGTKSYTLTAEVGGCGPGAVNIRGDVEGGCAVSPLDVSFACPGDLVSHYPFDGTLEDIVGGLEGTLTGPADPLEAVYIDDGADGQALRFNNDYGVDIANVAPNDFTISVWIRMDFPQTGFFPDGSVWWQGRAVLQGEIAGDVDDAGLTMVNDVALFGIGGPDRTIRGTTPLADGEFHLLTATRRIDAGSFRSELKLYVDGELEAEGTAPNTRPVNRHTVWGVGRQAQNRGLFGDLDDVRIYARALSAEEIQELYTGCSENATLARELSEAKLSAAESTDVTVTATNVAAAGGPVTLTETIPPGLSASSSDDGVTVGDSTVTIVFGEDGAKSYSLSAPEDGCGPGLFISGEVDGGCAIAPSNTNIICLGDLVSHYPLDGSLDDIAGGRVGLLAGFGGPNYVDGVDGDALLFSNDYGVDVENTAPDDFTLSLWVLMEDPQAPPCCGGTAFWMGHALFQGETTGQVNDSAITVLTDVASFGIGNPDTTVRGTTVLTDGDWHLITATRFINTDTGMSELRLYVDGGLDAEGISPNLESLTANAVWGVGRQAQNRGLVGEIDDVRIYARALSPAEVQGLFTGCDGSVSLARALGNAKLGGGDSSEVTVTAGNVAEAGGPVTLIDTVPAGLSASSADAGVTIDGNTVTIVFDSDGSKSYTVTADAGGCPIGSTISGSVVGDCVVRPDDTRLICTGDLVSHYPLDGTVDEAIGGGTPVISGTGVPAFVDGVAGGQALRFNNDYGLDIPNLVPDDFTLSLLVRMSAPQAEPCCGGTAFWMGHALFQGETTGDVDDSALTVLRDVASFGVGNPDTTITGTTTLVGGGWHLVTATRSIDVGAGESVLRLYVDGELEAVGPAPNIGPLTSNGVWGIGRQAQNRGLVGDIDDVRVYARALSQAEIRELVPDSVERVFRRGDADSNGDVNISDPIFSLTFQFLGGSPPDCMDALDSDDNGVVNISDPIANLTYQFLGGAVLPPPGPFNCGPDPTEDSGGDLGCDTSPECP